LRNRGRQKDAEIQSREKVFFFPTRTYLGKQSLQNEREALLK